MTTPVGSVVFPGDTIREVKSIKNVTILGPGLRRNDLEANTLQVTRPGRLKFRAPNVYWIDGVQKRYIPKRNDLVVGVITKKAGDTLKIDIGSSEPASLSMLAFEGATKKLKPDVQVGDVVYGRLLNAHREMEPEIVCIDSYFKAGKLGVLSNDGFVMNITTQLVNRLLKADNALLRTLGKKFPYEIAIGMNGKVWIRAKAIKDFLSLIRSLEAAETENDDSINQLCRQI